MSRIAERFDKLKAEGRQALIPYVTAGDCNPEITVPLMHAMVEAGADILELGVPFSDPMADGPVIQQACERALLHNVSLRDVLEMVSQFREKDEETPVVLMGYLNPIEVMGYVPFAQAACDSGVDGVLTVDLPPEEGAAVLEIFKEAELDPIFLLSPTSTAERIGKICASSSGFVYYVSLKGVTGSASLDVDAVAEKLGQIRGLTDLPIGVGFGIRDAESAAKVSSVADAVVVGSAVVNRIAANVEQPEKIIPEIAALLKDMRMAMDA